MVNFKIFKKQANKGFLLKFGAENGKKVSFEKLEFQKKDFLLATQKFSLFKSLKSYFYKSCLPGFIKVGRTTHFHSAKIISFRIRNKTVNTSCYQIFVYLPELLPNFCLPAWFPPLKRLLFKLLLLCNHISKIFFKYLRSLCIKIVKQICISKLRLQILSYL